MNKANNNRIIKIDKRKYFIKQRTTRKEILLNELLYYYDLRISDKKNISYIKIILSLRICSKKNVHLKDYSLTDTYI